MATLIDNPEYTANEIYEIASTDPVEGASSGASFGGLGIDNEPHQQFANRTSFLYGRQNINIANIAVLQAFVAKFRGLLGPNGYIQIPLTNLNLGEQVLCAQWGFVSWIGQTPQNPGVILNASNPVTFPFSFRTKCFAAFAAFGTDDLTGAMAMVNETLSLEIASLGVTGMVVASDLGAGSGGSITISNPAKNIQGLTGFYWWAIGI